MFEFFYILMNKSVIILIFKKLFKSFKYKILNAMKIQILNTMMV